MSSPVARASFRSSGFKWDVASEFADTLERVVAPRLREFESADGCAVLNEGDRWTVLRIEIPAVREGYVVVRLHRPADWSAAPKWCIRRSRARVEWDTLLRLQANGVPCPAPLAVGERRRFGVLREACLVMKYVKHEGGLQSFLNGEKLSSRERRMLMESAGWLVRQMHDSGVEHRDLHGENIVVTRAPGGRPEVLLIDHHRARLVFGIGARRRVSDLAALLFSLRGCTRLVERARLVKSYVGAGKGAMSGERFREFFRRVLRREEWVRRRRNLRAARRSLRDSTYFVREKIDDGVAYRRRDFPQAEVLRSIARHRRTVRARRGEGLVKDDVKTAVTDVPFERGDSGVCVKEFKRRGSVVGVVRRFGGSKARKAWRAANGLVAMEIGTPLPLACVEKRRGGAILQESFLVTESARDHEPLSDFLGDSGGDALLRRDGGARERLIEAMADLLSRMHAAGAYHRDFRPGNLLARWDGGCWDLLVVDLEDVELNHFPSKRERLVSFVRLLGQSGMRDEADCVKFLEVYKRRHRDMDVGDYWGKISAAMGEGGTGPC